MRSSRRVTQRVAPALASIASVLLFATCDFDKISGTPTPITQQEIDRLFSITPADSTIILGGTTALSIAPGTNVNLTGTTQSWSSSNTAVVAITETGVATGVTIGNAVITARLIAPELDTGYSKTRALRVRYKGIKACGVAPQCSPSSLDSIAGLNLSRPVSFFGTNNADARQTTALTGVTLTTRDSGAATNTVASVTGSNVFARRNGAAYVIGVFENMRDSIKVRVRQVAKSLTFPTTEYTANAINANRTLPITMRDVNDSVMTASPRLRFSSSNPAVVTIDSITGVLRVLVKDTARIFVRVDTILNRSQKLVVRQAISNITKAAGDIASDTVGRLVTIAPKVTVVDSGNTAIEGDTVIFRVGSGAGVVTDSIKLTDASGQATVGSWQLGPTAGPQTLIATSGPRTTTFTVTGIAQRAYKLMFGTQPRSAATGAALTPAVTVTIRDSLNNLVTTASDSVFVAIGNNPGTATLSGTRRAAAVNGVATFANLALNAAASGYTLAATGAGALLSTISDAFDIFGAANKLGVVRQPVGTSAGAILDTIQIAVQDAAGNTVANDTRNVSLAIGTNPGSGGLSGTTTVAAVGGIATFTGLSINAAGAGYTLNATATGVTSAATNAFTIAPVGAANKLAFTTQPGNVASGATPSLAVTIQDANGATVTSSSASITLTLIAGTTVGTLSGTTTRNAVNGVALFPGISIDKVGTGYKFAANSTGLTGAESNAFNVTPGTATKLGFLAHPTHSVVSTTMSPAVTVAIQDAAGNTVTGQAATSVTVTSQNCTGTIAGTTAVNTAAGIATFSGITIGATQAANCTLQATATGLTTATSSAFNMVAATGAIRLVFGTQPSQATAGNVVPFFTVRAVDANGTTVSTATPAVTISVLSGPTTTLFGTPSATASSGVASFSNVQIRTAGTYKLLATSTGFKADSSVAFTVVPGAVSKVGFVTQPTSITAGSPFTPVLTASFQDQFGNTVSTQNGTIEVGVQAGPGGGVQVVGTRFQTSVNGVAEFPGLTINKAFTGYTLFAASTGLSISVSSSFNVSAGPVSTLSFTSGGVNLVAGNPFSAVVQATDAAGNAITTFNSPITLGVSGGDGTASVIGTTTVTPTSGSASFSNLQIQKAGTNYKLTASASGLSTAESNSFTVFAGNAAKLGWLDQPQNTFQNAPLNPAVGGQQPRVAVQDQFGNTVNNFSTIQITLVNAAGVQMRDNGIAVASKNYNMANGVVTIDGLTLQGTVANMQLNATSFSGYTAALSSSFNLSAFGPKSKVGFKVEPTNGTLAVALSPAVEVAVQDAYGNTVTDATDQITVVKRNDGAVGGGTTVSGGAATAAVAGVATFQISLDKAGNSFTLEATGAGITGTDTSAAFNIFSPGVVTSGTSIADMVRVNDRIYWLESGATGALKSVAVTGGAVTTHSGSFAIANAARMASDGTNLYWIEAGSNPAGATGSVRRYNIAGGGIPATIASGLSDVRTDANTFAIDATNVYFSGRSQTGTTAAIKTAALSGTGVTPTDIFAPAANTGLTHYFTLGGGFVFAYDGSTGVLKRMTTSGASIQNLNTGTVSAQRLAYGGLNGTTLYFTEAGGNLKTIASANTTVTAGTPGFPISGLFTVYNMVLDGTNMYIKNSNVLRRYDVTGFGGTVQTADIATNGAINFQTLLIDGTYLYYSNNASGIGKIQK
jgi:hypothetical protein